MGTLGRPKAEVVEALRELGYGSFGLHGWRYPVRTARRAAGMPVRRASAALRSVSARRDNELAIATALGMAAIGATAAIAGFVTRELRPSRGNAVPGFIVAALGLAALVALGFGRPARHR